MRDGFKLKRPCKNCPFSPLDSRITFANRERAEEIEETAYRNGFPCHLSAINTQEDEDGNENEDGGYVFGPKTQHCAGAIMMYIAGGESEWPGIDNDEELGEALSKHMDWTAPHCESIEDFLDNAVLKAKRR